MLKNRIMGLAIAALFLGFATQASASLTYVLNDSFGAVPVSGDIVITLTNAGTDNVTLEIDLTALNSTEFIKELYLNTDTEVAFVTGSGLDAFDWDPLAHKSDGDGFHDLLIKFSPGAGDRLEGGAVYSFNLTGTGLDESDFDDFGTASDKGQFHVVAKINSTGGDGEGSDWVGDGGGPSTPEPNAALLFAIGAATVGARVRRR
jgi:hypothetical protein